MENGPIVHEFASIVTPDGIPNPIDTDLTDITRYQTV
jgi:hypothetical protein